MSGNGTDRQFFMKLHRASSLHFDFRLEHDGVLKSWAIPDGPCLDPAEHRRAVVVEDHDIKSGSLERVIRPGQRGAGPVLLWDRGIWLPCQDVDQGLRDGHLEFHLCGIRLKGLWSLNRVKGKNWVLTKEQDDEARSLSEMDIVVEMKTSVRTGRTIDEVAAEPDRYVTLTSDSQNKTRSKKNAPDPKQQLLSFCTVES